ncbi:zinc finger CCCH domain-containing protein 44-like [Rhododendron vialii]|uniref:zinc finger CCCH domain-containing protein 44-like n=1 Tax=Rhododendron vialii TaxID=182163 RepID=UPI00265F1F37|nr:zinc finger CCCH domain-containing protein 44-like [Rhododendron vialii]
MDGADSSGSGLHNPRAESDSRSSDPIAAAVELFGLSNANSAHPMHGPQLIGVTATVTEIGGGKRKRGRPPKGQSKQTPLKKRKEDEEEDVCFICFDGGSLVLCDRKGCPKAYHPACIKRDEAFFRSKAKWNCGWHICSSCQKAAHYMCYTCTYSLCKACAKYADYVCVRGNKGFCTTCMKTIMLIENNGQGNKEMVQVDFDDKSSWEYLFKVYWVLLKEKLSLTLDELTQAQNPWKAAGTVAYKAKSLDVHYGGNEGKVAIPSITSRLLEANNCDRPKEQLNLPKKGGSPSTDRSISDNNSISMETKEWASKELLEFVAHMRNGDTSFLSQFDVQTLLLDYIKINNLRDHGQQSQIICDLRLRNLFGRPLVGHVEMLKLLEFHCLTKEDSRKDVIQDNTVHDVLSQVEGDGNNDNLFMMGKHKKHKTRGKGDERGPQINLDEYAAIDVHNIKLIYLRRDLMESLLVDNGKFHDKVVGSFVRIRISSGDPNIDMYRLVEVVGTCKVAVPYKIGDKTTDFKLAILNLDKKENISIDAISNQEFSEDECQRLRQTIKCGLVAGLTVGKVRERAMALQEVKLNDRLETEILQLNNLRDQASEKGHNKELRDCVEKLELLKTPEEYQRRLHEIPDVHADPNMDPNCHSDEDPAVDSNHIQDEHAKPRYSGLSRNERDPNLNSSLNDDVSYHSGSRSMSSPFYLDKGASSRDIERKNKSLVNEGKDACGSNIYEKPGNRVDSSGSVVGGWNNQIGSFSGVGSEASVASLSTGSAPVAYDSEIDKLWHYRDPNGSIQGPFCMLQLRKWRTTGYFPPDMRIWSLNDEEGHSFLLMDVLDGHLSKSTSMGYASLPTQEVIKGSSDGGLRNCDGGQWSGSMNEAVAQSKASRVYMNDIQTGSSNSEHPQVHCPAPSVVFIEQAHEPSLHQASGDEVQMSLNRVNGIPHGNTVHQTTGGQIHENQSSSLTVNYSSNNWDSNSGFASVVNSTDMVEKIFGIDINLPSPPRKTSNGDSNGPSTQNQQSVPSNGFVQDLNIPNLPSSTSKPIDGDEKADSTIHNVPSPQTKPADKDENAKAIDNKQFVSTDFEVQLPEVSHKWGGYSSTHTKPSFEEWNSGFLSSIKSPQVGNDRAAISTSKCDELATPSPPHPSCSWLASVTEPIEISTLAEESVSDLLAEVDAMESQGGGDLASPTSVNGGEDLFHDSKIDCFTSHMSLVPPLVKNVGLASTEEINLPPPPQLTPTVERIRAPSQGGVLDPVKRSSKKSSTSSKVEVETKLTEPSTIGRDMVDGKHMETGVGRALTQGNSNRGIGHAQGTPRGSSNPNRSASSGFTGRDSHSKYGGERLVSPRDRAFQSPRDQSPRDRDSGFSRGRPSGNSRQSSFGGSSGGVGGGSSGGGYSRPQPKGPRVCKFFESGYCKKGAACNYLHQR